MHTHTHKALPEPGPTKDLLSIDTRIVCGWVRLFKGGGSSVMVAAVVMVLMIIAHADFCTSANEEQEVCAECVELAVDGKLRRRR